MIRKLRARFILFMMLIVSILLSVMMGMVIRFNRFTLREQSVSVLKRAASLSANRTDPGEALPEELPVAWFSVLTAPDGELIAWGSGHFDLSDQEDLRALLELTGAEERSTGVLEGKSLRYYRSGRVVAFADISGEELIMRNIRRSCITVGLGSFVLFFLLSLLLAYVTARPVEKAWNQQRQFVADASHELKTPLSVVMANAELLQSGDCDDAGREKYSGNILTTSYQMRSLVEQMLEMARVDDAKPKLAALDLSQLVQDAVLSVQLLYEEKGRPLTSDIQEGLHIRGSETLLYQLLDVLLDNALKYSEGEGAVEVGLKSQGSTCLLSVTSPGEPLKRQQQRDVFKRFYRVDPARSRNGSYGLGLPIAQRIVQLHRGRIRALARERGNCFQVVLPLSVRG